MKSSDVILSVAGAIITILLGGNAYFVSRMVDKVDKIEDNQWSLRQEITILKVTLESEMKEKRR